jgi:homoserine kinase type II
MHLAAADYPGRLPNPRGRDWWRQTAPRVLPFLTKAQADLLQDELSAQEQFSTDPAFAALPGSAVHADLFRDNVLVRDDGRSGAKLGGVIDFYFAGVDSWLYDLAVTVNDWCIDDSNGSLVEDRLSAFLAAYRAERPPQAVEFECWPMMLRAAGLRFWLSRLFDLHLPRPAQIVNVKDPAHFERLLTHRRARVIGLG